MSARGRPRSAAQAARPGVAHGVILSAAMIDPAIVERAEQAARAIAPLAEQIEGGRRLPEAAVAALVGAGVFKLLVPHAHGGAQTTVPTLMSVIEAVARADGSAGWCTMIGATSGLIAAFLPPELAHEIYEPDDVISGGVFAPLGRALAVDGGYRVTGRWPFCSGCQHTAWIMGSALVPSQDPARPELRSLLFRRSEVQIHDTWDTSGLRGTGSHDYTVEDLFVPAARSFSLLGAPVVDAPLYRQPFFGTLAAGVASVSLGIARAAIDALVGLAGSKQAGGSRKTLAHRELVQLQVAQAEARLQAARAGLFAAVDAAAAEVARAGAASLRTRALVRVAACHAASECAGAVDLVYDAGGGTSIYRTSPLQRCFRDAHVVTAHAMVNAQRMATAGRALLGLDGETSTL